MTGKFHPQSIVFGGIIVGAWLLSPLFIPEGHLAVFIIFPALLFWFMLAVLFEIGVYRNDPF